MLVERAVRTIMTSMLSQIVTSAFLMSSRLIGSIFCSSFVMTGAFIRLLHDDVVPAVEAGRPIRAQYCRRVVFLDNQRTVDRFGSQRYARHEMCFQPSDFGPKIRTTNARLCNCFLRARHARRHARRLGYSASNDFQRNKLERLAVGAVTIR